MREPLLAVTIGDPCGIGPEVIVKALAGSQVSGRTLLIGDAGVVRDAIARTGAPLPVRAINAVEQARFDDPCLNVLDPGTLKPQDITPGRVSAACGRATLLWGEMATALASAGKVAAIVTGPINMEATGPMEVATDTGKAHLLLISGPLRIVHLTDHITLREMLERVRMQDILELIRLTHACLRRWGIPQPRIGVAGLNPHCYGPEDEREIIPAIAAANKEGIDALGPISPDTIFHRGLEGEFDCLVAHYHDQGHIAIKTWRFDGICSLHLGRQSYISMSVAHGTAFDIAGQGIADPSSMVEALTTAASLAAGRGFPGK